MTGPAAASHQTRRTFLVSALAASQFASRFGEDFRHCGAQDGQEPR